MEDCAGAACERGPLAPETASNTDPIELGSLPSDTVMSMLHRLLPAEYSVRMVFKHPLRSANSQPPHPVFERLGTSVSCAKYISTYVSHEYTTETLVTLFMFGWDRFFILRIVGNGSLGGSVAETSDF